MTRTRPVAVLTALLLSGCPDDGDGSTDGASTSNAGSTSDGAETASPSDSGTTMGGEGSGTQGEGTAADSGTAEGGATGTAGDSGSGSGSGDGSGSDSGSESGSGTAGGEAQLCADTDGTWDDLSCGHYVCGAPPQCQALIPGCDCGPTANFVDGVGCMEDDKCAAQFACGDALACSLTDQYCQVVHPGVKGAPTNYACSEMPAACVDAPTCDCLEEETGVGLAGVCSGSAAEGLTIDLFAP